MADSNFYNKPESDQVLKKYNDHKSELASVMTDWEIALEQLG
jgi:hypothetical protein